MTLHPALAICLVRLPIVQEVSCGLLTHACSKYAHSNEPPLAINDLHLILSHRKTHYVTETLEFLAI